MTATPPTWVNRIDPEHKAEAVAIWQEHRKVVSEAQRTFGTALGKLKAKCDKTMVAANEQYREAKRALRDKAGEAT